MAKIEFRNVRGVPQGEPIVMDRRRRRLSTIAKQHANPARPFLVSVHRGVQPGENVVATDATVRSRKTWKDVLIGADDIVLITYMPLGRGGAGGQQVGKQIGMAVGMLALAVAMPYAVGAIGIVGTMGKVVAAALTAGIPMVQSYTFERSAR